MQKKTLFMVLALVGMSTPAFSQTAGLPAPTAVANTYTAQQTFNGGIVITPPTGTPDIFSMGGGATAPTLTTNTVSFIGPNAATFTAYGFQFSATAPTGLGLMEVGVPASGISQVTFPSPTAMTTGAQCIAATSVTTPCTAYQSGAVTGLAATYAGTTVTLSSSLPSTGVYQFCPAFYEDSGSGSVAGSAVMEITYTTPGGFANSANQLQGMGFSVTTGYNENTQCAVISAKAATVLSYIVTTTGGAGTVNWEYNMTVTRLE